LHADKVVRSQTHGHGQGEQGQIDAQNTAADINGPIWGYWKKPGIFN